MKRLIAISCLALLLQAPIHARTESGVDFPETLDVQGQPLTLNGTGTRKKLFMKLYAAALYLESASTDAADILAADAPMSLSLEITSGLIDSEKMEKAVAEGFDKSTNGNTASIQDRIDRFLAVLREKIEKKDNFQFDYLPGAGTAVMKNGEEKTVIEGKDFKSALFGIWLSEKPVQKNLKNGLLGK